MSILCHAFAQYGVTYRIQYTYMYPHVNMNTYLIKCTELRNALVNSDLPATLLSCDMIHLPVDDFALTYDFFVWFNSNGGLWINLLNSKFGYYMDLLWTKLRINVTLEAILYRSFTLYLLLPMFIWFNKDLEIAYHP